MAYGSRADRGTPAMAEINIIPLCDVLLVVLIIFMVTAPALSRPIALDLPGRGPPAGQPTLPPVTLRIAASGQVFWNGEDVDRAQLLARMQGAAGAGADAQPLVRIDAAGDADYQAVVQVLAAAERAGLARIGFLRQ